MKGHISLIILLIAGFTVIYPVITYSHPIASKVGLTGVTNVTIDGNNNFISIAKGNGWAGNGTKSSPIILSLINVVLPFNLTIINTYLYFEINGLNLVVENNLYFNFINTTNGIIKNNSFSGNNSSNFFTFIKCSNFIIQNNNFSLSVAYYGILIKNSRNMFILNNDLKSLVSISYSQNIDVQNNTLLQGLISNIDTNLQINFNNISIPYYNGIYSYNFGIDLYYGDKNVSIYNNNIFNESFAIAIEGSTNINLQNNTISDNGYGVFFHNTSQSSFINNILNYNQYGMVLEESNNNSVKNNIIFSNKNYGISLDIYSQNNSIINNKMYNNTANIECVGSCQKDNSIQKFSSNKPIQIDVAILIAIFTLMAITGVMLKNRYKKIKTTPSSLNDVSQLNRNLDLLCTRCGAKIIEKDTQFCSKCGSKIKNSYEKQ